MDGWPMIGRAEERHFIADVVATPDRSGVLLAGHSGVGKTRLIHEVLTSIPGLHVEWVTASESVRPLPFGALAQLLPSNLFDVNQVDLLSVLGQDLQRRAEGRPIVLVVDDVHLLDGLSAGFIEYVATRGLATVLLTLRSGSALPDALVRLCRIGAIPRLELQALSRSEFDEMVERALDGIVESVSLDRMWEATRGNVLFARELIADVLEAGELRQIHGVWRWAGGVGPAPRLQEAIAGRLDGLMDPERRFLELLSVGEPLAVITAEQVAAGEVLVDLERRGLIAVEGDDVPSIRFSHPLFGEVLRAGMPALLRRQINRQLAHILRSEGERTPASLLKLAVLWQGSGERADPVVLAGAAHVANQLSDHSLAEELAVDSLEQQGTFLAQLELGWSLLRRHRFDEAVERLASLVGNEPDDNSRERLADGLALAMGHGLGQVENALALMAEIEDSALDVTTRLLIQCHRANLLAFFCQYAEAIELGRSAMRADGDDRIVARSLTSVASSLVMIGKTEDALSLTETGLACALRVREELPRAPSWAVSSRCTALAFAGRVPEGLELLEFALSLSTNPPEQRTLANGYRARFLLFEGRAASAARTLKEAGLGLRTDPGYGSWCLALLAEAEALLGHSVAAEESRSESLSVRCDDRLSVFVDQRRALAWVDAQAGRLTEAIAALWAAADIALERGQRSFELIILDDLLRLGEADAAVRARDVSAFVEGLLGKAVGLHAQAVISKHGKDLELAASSFAMMSHSLTASELWAGASTAYRREGLQARSTKAAKKSHDMAALCEGARRRPGSLPDQVEPLSRRQREVALLAARGASNAEIANVLSLSVRTVESHLYAAFAKLGLTARDELTSVMAESVD
jgi:DNA-binding CsgD family transcriptional regulator/tetratricopeptide (TPR) repeat protein